MTLLHQAAQKAVEALEIARTGLQWYRGMMPEYVDGSDGEADEEIQAAVTALESALQQQPEPVAAGECQQFEVWADGQGFPLRKLETSDGYLGYLDLRTQGAWEAWQACAALQHQEVPREPVADERILHLWDTHVGDPCAKYPMTDFDKLEFARAVLRAAVLAPSTTQQQEVGSGYEFAGGFIQNRNANGSTRWEQVSKQYENDADVVKLYRAASPSTPERAEKDTSAPACPESGKHCRPDDGECQTCGAVGVPVTRNDEQDAKFKLTMRISYERAGRCFWHPQCKAQHHAAPMKIERDDPKAKQTLLRCTACNMAGWYPHGSVGEVCCAGERTRGVPAVDTSAPSGTEGGEPA